MTSHPVSKAVERLRGRLAGRGVLLKVDAILVRYQADFLAVFTMEPGLAAIARKPIVQALYSSGFSVVEIADIFAIEATEVRVILKPVSPFTSRRARGQTVGKALEATREIVAALGKDRAN